MIEQDTLKNIRNKNLSDILQVLRNKGTCSLSELSQNTDGGLTTVKKCVAQAIDYGMAIEGNIAESTGGRKARQYLINREYQYYFIAIVDNNNLIIKVFDFAINCVEDYQKSFEMNLFFSALNEEIEKQARKYTIGTIGVSLPCVVKNGVVLDWYYNPEMVGFDIKNKLEEKYKANVVVQNDMKLTALGIFDVWVAKLKSALIIPITGFAHSMTSAALEYRKEGLVLGIGSNIFKLAGTVILYGIVSVYIFGLIRLFLIGG